MASDLVMLGRRTSSQSCARPSGRTGSGAPSRCSRMRICPTSCAVLSTDVPAGCGWLNWAGRRGPEAAQKRAFLAIEAAMRLTKSRLDSVAQSMHKARELRPTFLLHNLVSSKCTTWHRQQRPTTPESPNDSSSHRRRRPSVILVCCHLESSEVAILVEDRRISSCTIDNWDDASRFLSTHCMFRICSIYASPRRLLTNHDNN